MDFWPTISLSVCKVGLVGFKVRYHEISPASHGTQCKFEFHEQTDLVEVCTIRCISSKRSSAVPRTQHPKSSGDV